MTTLISTNPAKNYEEVGSVTISTKKDVQAAFLSAKDAFYIFSVTLALREESHILRSL